MEILEVILQAVNRSEPGQKLSRFKVLTWI